MARVAYILGFFNTEAYMKALTDAFLTSDFEVISSEPSAWMPKGRFSVVQKADFAVILRTKASEKSEYFGRVVAEIVGYSEEKGSPQIIAVELESVGNAEALVGQPQVLASGDSPEVTAEKVLKVVAHFEGMRLARSQAEQQKQERVEQQASTFLQPVIDQLRADQQIMRASAKRFYNLSFWCIAAAASYAVYRGVRFHLAGVQTWTQITQNSINALIIIGTLTALARLAFVLGRSYMIEALTNSDRAHAISFGRFFLQAFGQGAEWAQLKDIFAHWNVDRGASFTSQQASDVDPVVIQAALKVVETVTGLKDKSSAK